MRKKIVFVLISGLLLTSCILPAPAKVETSPAVTFTLTNTAVETATLPLVVLPPITATTVQNTLTLVSTPTAAHKSFDPGSREWLVVLSGDALIAMNPDGSGSKVLVPKPSHYVWGIDPQPNPVGNLITFITTPDPEVPVHQEKTLNIISVPDGKLLKQIPLVDSQKVKLKMDGDDSALQVTGMNAWSPDGNTLAVVAALDGPAADVYFFDLPSGVLQRVSKEPNNPCNLTWSPDGQWLVYNQCIGPGGISSKMKAVWAINRQSSQVKEILSIEDQFWIGWAPGNRLIAQNLNFSNLPKTIPGAGLQFIDLEKETITPLLSPAGYQEGTLLETLYLPNQNWLYVLVTPYVEGALRERDILKISLDDGKVHTLFQGKDRTFESRGCSQTTFKCFVELSASVLVISKDDQVTQLPAEKDLSASPVSSPDGLWVAFPRTGNSPLRLISADGKTAQNNVTADDAQIVTWQPDSTGLFYTIPPDLFCYRTIQKDVPPFCQPIDDWPYIFPFWVMNKDIK